MPWLLLRSVMSSVCNTTLRSVRGAVAPVSVCTVKAPNGLQMPHIPQFAHGSRSQQRRTKTVCNGHMELQTPLQSILLTIQIPRQRLEFTMRLLEEQTCIDVVSRFRMRHQRKLQQR